MDPPRCRADGKTLLRFAVGHGRYRVGKAEIAQIDRLPAFQIVKGDRTAVRGREEHLPAAAERRDPSRCLFQAPDQGSRFDIPQRQAAAPVA